MNRPERRQDARIHLTRPAKLRCDQAAGRYLCGTTRDVSPSGVLIQMDYPTRLAVGERIRIGIADGPRQALLAHDQMVEGTIVRCLGHHDSQHIAIRFHQRQTLAAAG